MKLTNLALTASILALFSAPAIAAEGVYIDGHGGWNHQHTENASAGGAGSKIEYNEGWLAGAALGYDFGNGWRNEIEATFRRNNVDEIGGAGADDRAQSWAFMYNGIYAFNDSAIMGFKPYLGAGIGWVHTKLDAAGLTGGRATDSSDNNLGIQGIAGAEYSIDENWGLYADYRYLTTWNRPSYTTSAGDNVRTSYNNSSVVVGLRYTFAAPAPVAAAEPAPYVAPATVQEEGSVSRKYLVFFDFNKATLTPEAVDVLKQAANDASAGQAVALEVSGHTDTSGSASYNEKLSSKRAAAVKAELAKLGISSSSISSVAKGESDPLVPTGDGVKEPQNRRAEITYVIKAQR